MRNTCEVKGCEAFCVGRGLCRKHYMRVQRTGTTDDRPAFVQRACSIPDCVRPHAALGFCHAHWKQRYWKGRRMAARLAEPRDCAFCGEPVSPDRRRHAAVSYCSRRCKERARVASGQGAAATRRSYFKTRYGLTVEQVDEMASHGCAICGTTEWMGRHERPHVDHDHKTDRVRGLLCHNCNVLLGHAHEDPAILQAAIRYIS